MKRRTRAYVHENFLYMRPDVVLRDDAPLLAEGVIDSMGIMELLQFVQESFGVAVADEDITEENFGTIDAIARYVASRQDAQRLSA